MDQGGIHTADAAPIRKVKVVPGCGSESAGDALPPGFETLVRLVADQLERYVVKPTFGSHQTGGRLVASFVQMSEKLPEDASLANHLVTLGFRDLSRIMLGYTHPPDDAPFDKDRFTPQVAARHADGLVTPARDSSKPANGWPDANFFTFAQWASLTIGRNVSNRFAPRLFDPATNNALRGAFSRLAIDVRQTNNGQLSRLLMGAQRVGFEEIVKGVSALWDKTAVLEGVFEERIDAGELPALDGRVEPTRAAVLEDLERVEKAIAAHLKAEEEEEERRLIPEKRRNRVRDEDPRRVLEDRDERYADLEHGLVGYFLARRAHQAGQEDARAELIFRSNVQIEAFVQRKVESVLAYSADGIASDYFRQQFGIDSSERRGAGRWRRRVNQSAVRSFERRFDDAWSRLLTDQVLVARVGDELLRLGRDLPDPPGATTFFPPALDPLYDSWATNLQLRYDHSYGHGAGTAANRWGDFDDRMNWLVNLLRSRQRSNVWKEPFTDREEVLVRARQDPTSRLEGLMPWMP